MQMVNVSYSSSMDYKPLKNTNSTTNSVSVDNQPNRDEFKKITKGQIKDILKTPQCARSDCYLVSSLKALAKSGFGKQMLKNSVKSNADKDIFEVKFNRYDDSKYDVSNDKYYTFITGRNSLNPTGAIEKATSNVVNDKSSAKPRILRMFGYDTNLEGNMASCFMKTLTGKTPISIGDEGILPLSMHEKQATELLNKIGDLPINKHSFVAGSKLTKTNDGIGKMHYYVLKSVDKDKKTVQLVNPRYVDLSKPEAVKDFEAMLKLDDLTDAQINEEKEEMSKNEKVINLSYDKFMKNFRSMVGYFDK